MSDLVIVVVIALVAGFIGVGLGIFYVAPRISRLADRDDEDPGARDD